MDNGMWSLSPLIASLIFKSVKDTSNLKTSQCSAMGSGILYSEKCTLVSLIVQDGQKQPFEVVVNVSFKALIWKQLSSHNNRNVTIRYLSGKEEKMLLQIVLGDLFPPKSTMLCSIKGPRTTESPRSVHSSQTWVYCGGLVNQHILLVAASSTALSRNSLFKKSQVSLWLQIENMNQM